MTAARQRVRPRDINLANEDPRHEMQALVRQIAENNRAAKHYSGIAKEAEKRLFKLMADQNVHSLANIECQYDGDTFRANAEIKQPERNTIDVGRLAELVEFDTLLKCVSATQAAVKANAGSTILNQVLTKKVGDDTLYVKEQK